MIVHSCHCTLFIHILIKAGLLMYTKDYNKIIEKEAEVLGMPHFYLGKYSFYII